MDNTGTRLLYSEPPITYRLAKDQDLVRANKILNGLFDGGHNFLLFGATKGILSPLLLNSQVDATFGAKTYLH